MNFNDLSSRPNKELDELYNQMRIALGQEPAGKAKDKPSALARIEKLKPAYEAHLEAMLPPITKLKPAKTAKVAKGDNPRTFRFNYPVQDKIQPPSRGNTKFAAIVAGLRKGLTFNELLSLTMSFTKERELTTKEMADENRRKKNAGEPYEGFCTSTVYRAWKDVNNIVNKHGYGTRWNYDADAPIVLFDNKEDAAEWDRQHGRG
ncbi:MAG: hypothetical protein ACXWWG_00615 [Nitrospira sp.]